MSCHVMSGRHVMSYITSYHKTSHRNVLYRIISYYIIYHIPQANYIAAYLYDVTMMYLIALNATVAEEGDPRNGSQLFKNSIHLQFDGIATKHIIMYNSILNDLKFLRNVNIYIYIYLWFRLFNIIGRVQSIEIYTQWRQARLYLHTQYHLAADGDRDQQQI